MNLHATILSRTITTEFYRVNAMFFLVVMGLCFGFMGGAEHMALAGFFVSSVWLVLIPIGTWTVYTIKVIAYNRREIRTERHWFLYSLPLLGLSRRIVPLVVVATGQLAPALAYGTFVAATAFKQHQYLELSMVVSTLLILVMITTWSLDRLLVFPAREESTSLPVRWLDKHFSKPITWMFTEGVVRLQPGMMYITKLTTCLVIFGATRLYEYDVYDERLYMMTACVAFAANLALVYQYQRFEAVQLLMMRSLPIPFTKRVVSFIITMIVLCFPEIAMLITNLPGYLPIRFYFYSLFFGIAFMLMGYGALYIRHATFDYFTRWIFFVSMGLILVILFGVPVWAPAIVLASAGIILLRRNYYSFETNA